MTIKRFNRLKRKAERDLKTLISNFYDDLNLSITCRIEACIEERKPVVVESYHYRGPGCKWCWGIDHEERIYKEYLKDNTIVVLQYLEKNFPMLDWRLVIKSNKLSPDTNDFMDTDLNDTDNILYIYFRGVEK